MSCNGCRVLRKGCSDSCVLRQCLRWIDSPDAQGHATVFVAKFFGRAGMMALISSVADTQRPALFQSLLYEACGRTINPVFGAVGLLCSGNWKMCQEAVETVLKGGLLCPSSAGTGRPGTNLLMQQQQQQQPSSAGGGSGGKLPKVRLGRGYINLATFHHLNGTSNSNVNGNNNSCSSSVVKMKQEVVEEMEGARSSSRKRRSAVRYVHGEEERFIGARNKGRDDDGVEEDKEVLEGGGAATCEDEGPGLDLTLSCFDESSLVKRKGHHPQQEALHYHHHQHQHQQHLGDEFATATTSTSAKRMRRRCSSPSCHSSEADSDTTTDLSISIPAHSAAAGVPPLGRELLLDLLH